MLRRLRNLWHWSGINPYQSVIHARGMTPETAQRIARQQGNAVIISATDPADELIETIRQENTREA